MASVTRTCAGIALAIGVLTGVAPTPAAGQVLIVGNDEKQGWDENAKAILREPGKDTLSVIDISKPEAPQITATIPLSNSVVGPPTNLAIHPSGEIAFVANSMMPVVEGWGHKLAPDDKIFMVNLKADRPR
jgi:DNA-binding beta-propeller fold protein YncE